MMVIVANKLHTHRLQPLDVSFFGPLKTYYDQEVTKWLKCNPGRTVTQYQICPLFGKAYGKAATIANAQSGFEHSGIWPLNPDIFPNHLYAPAATTDIPACEPHKIPETIGATSICESEDNSVIEQPNKHAEAVEVGMINQKTSPVPQVPVATISPVPSISRANTLQRKRRVNKAPTVLTDSPYLKELKEKAQNKHEQEKRIAAKKAKQKLNFGKEEFYNEDLFDNTNDDSEDCPCLYCNEQYTQSKPGEHWLKCQQCKLWSHTECAGINKKTKSFVCDICK